MPHALFPLEQPDRDPVDTTPSGGDVDPVADATNEFDDLVGMATQLLDAPMAALTVTEDGRCRGLAARGLDPAMHACQLVLCGAFDGVGHLQLADVGVAGVRFWLGVALVDPSGHRIGVLCVADRDVRDHVSDEAVQGLHRLARIATRLIERRALQRNNRIAEQIAKADFSGVVVADAQSCVSYANGAAEVLFDGQPLVGASLATLFPSHLQPDAEVAQAWLASEATLAPDAVQSSFDLRVRAADGSVRTLEAARCSWPAGGEHRIALILRDVTERRLLHDRHRRPSQKDELTGLARRAAMLALLDGFLRERAQPLGVALLGLDSFRNINDTLGHTVGDAVLQAAACRLQASLPPEARLARFGGDEFALLYPRTSQQAVDAHLRSVLLELSRPCEVDHHVIHMEASVGVAMCTDGSDGGELIARADLAMQRAKRNGGRQLRHFEPDMRAEAHDRRRLDVELRRASHEGEFELHYQPQVCLTTGLPTGAEALLRWRHPQRGLLAPIHFIDALAESPVGPVVGRWILERACQDAATWPTVGGRQLAVGVNLFPVQLDNERLPGEVDHALARSGLRPAHLELELTETIALRDDGVAATALASLRSRGISVAYDDFGTGYASLSVLRRLPVDRVKIDRSFVRDVLANRGDAAIVRSILLIARNFDLRVIAEGVETPEQAELLRELGCQEAQGFLYSPALPPQEFGRWIAARLADRPLCEMAVAGHA